MALTKVDAQLLNGAVTADSSGNVGIGTTSPVSIANYTIQTINSSATGSGLYLQNAGTDRGRFLANATATYVGARNGLPLIFESNATEQMRIDSSGNLLVGTTSVNGQGTNRGLTIGGGNVSSLTSFAGTYPGVTYKYNSVYEDGWVYWNGRDSGSTPVGGQVLSFVVGTATPTKVGGVACTATATSFATSSDYRLKENVAPMTGALATVQALKPVTYKWKADGSDGQGFIAHELQAVVPECVTGEKDAVDVEGNAVYQGIDTSFLVATLTAAIQELKAELDATKAEVAALKAGA